MSKKKNEKAQKNEFELFELFQNKEFIDRLMYKSRFGEKEELYRDEYLKNLSYKTLAKLFINKLLKLSTKKETKPASNIQANIDANKTICIVSPYHVDGEDGYYKRIKMVDEELLPKYKKIYLDCSKIDRNLFTIDNVDQNHSIIRFNSFDTLHIEKIKEYTKDIKVFYIHSVNMLLPDVVGTEFINYIFSKEKYTILDIHGAVSEEITMQGNPSRGALASMCERTLFDKADLLITVSKKMNDYYKEKGYVDKKDTLYIPIFNNLKTDQSVKAYNTKPLVIYSGGLQKWQKLDSITDALSKTKDKYEWKFFLTDENTDNNFIQESKSLGCRIYINNQKEMIKGYKEADFGLIFRDNIPVNNVASPTKINDYINFGVVPVTISNDIGDYKDNNLQTISREDLINGKIPDKKTRKSMASKNNKLLKKLTEERNANIEKLQNKIKKQIGR